ncbi:hypothetical protein LOZ65_003895 [Ophidiomyces ophidiicola]|nr:hypothetical protein LOZ65_003895 [Ophidiomyces ophidiicola]
MPDTTAPELENARKSSSPRTKSPVAPIPTPDYLANAHQEPVVASSPRPLLVILDMNGTLIYRNKSRPATSFIKRPYLDVFLRHIFERYKVMIWTSATPLTVREIVRKLFAPEVKSDNFVSVWARDKLDLTKKQYIDKVQVYKKLEKVWNDDFIQSKYPEVRDVLTNEQSSWSQSNTVLIDDNKLKAAGQPHNIIDIPEFTNDMAVDEKEILITVLRQLRILAMQRDVSRKLRQWGEMTEAADASLSVTQFWRTQLIKDEKELGLDDEIMLLETQNDVSESISKWNNAEPTNKKKKKKNKAKKRGKSTMQAMTTSAS